VQQQLYLQTFAESPTPIQDSLGTYVSLYSSRRSVLSDVMIWYLWVWVEEEHFGTISNIKIVQYGSGRLLLCGQMQEISSRRIFS